MLSDGVFERDGRVARGVERWREGRGQRGESADLLVVFDPARYLSLSVEGRDAFRGVGLKRTRERDLG